MGETRLRTYPSGRKTYTALYLDAAGKLKRVEGFDPIEVPAGARGGELKAIKNRCADAWRDREREVARHVAEARPLGQGLRKDMTFDEYAPLWLRTHDVGANRKKNLTTDINGLNTVFKGIPLQDIQPIDVRAFIAGWRAAGTGSCTMENRYTTFKAILRTAVVDGLIPRSPFDGGDIKKPRRVTKPRGRVITLEEYDRIAANVEEIGGPEARLLVDTLIESGLRWGEVSELRVEDLCDLGLSVAGRAPTSAQLSAVMAAATSLRTRRATKLTSSPSCLRCSRACATTLPPSGCVREPGRTGPSQGLTATSLPTSSWEICCSRGSACSAPSRRRSSTS